MPLLGDGCCLALTGRAFARLIGDADAPADVVSWLLWRTVIYARMSPDQKQQLLELMTRYA